MGIFKRKKWLKEKETAQQMELWDKPPCQRPNGTHMWRDFPPYILWDWDWDGSNKDGTIYMKEPYVCCLCGKRENKLLGKWTYSNISREQFIKEIQQITDEYKEIIKPAPVVEDMVNDAIMVDRQRLKYWDAIHAPEQAKPETEEERLTRYQIELLATPRRL